MQARIDESVGCAVAAEVPALGEHAHAVGARHRRGLVEGLRPGRCRCGIRQHRELGEVRGDEVGEGEQLAHRLLGIGVEEAIAARGDHDRIEHDDGRAGAAEPVGDLADHLGIREHPELHGIDRDVVGDRVELCAEELGGRHVHRANAVRVLRGERRDDGHAVAADRRDRLEVGLDTGPARRVAAGDAQHPRDRPRRCARRSRSARRRRPRIETGLPSPNDLPRRLRRIVRRTHRRHHGDPRRSGRPQPRSIRRPDAPDRHARQPDADREAGDACESVDAERRRVIGLRRRRVDHADPEVVDRAGRQLRNRVEMRRRVRGEPDHGIRPERLASLEHRRVTLAEVHPVDADAALPRREHHVEPVVHEQGRATGDGRRDGVEFTQQFVVARVLVAQLHRGHPAGDGIGDDGGHSAIAAERGIGDEGEGQVEGAPGAHATTRSVASAPASSLPVIRARSASAEASTAESASRNRTAKLPGPDAPSAASSAATV